MSIQNLDKSSFAEYITRNDFKSQSKYESIVLTKYQNKTHERSSLEKTQIAHRTSVLNESLFQNKEVHNGQSGKKIIFKQDNSSKSSYLNQSRAFEEINHSFSKNNNDHWIIKGEE
jgi:hypothetical protein